MAGAKFLGGKGLGIQQGTSVWVGSPKPLTLASKEPMYILSRPNPKMATSIPKFNLKKFYLHAPIFAFMVGNYMGKLEVLRPGPARPSPCHHMGPTTLAQTLTHTRLRACDHFTSSTLIGGKGGAGPKFASHYT